MTAIRNAPFRLVDRPSSRVSNPILIAILNTATTGGAVEIAPPDGAVPNFGGYYQRCRAAGYRLRYRTTATGVALWCEPFGPTEPALDTMANGA